MYMYMYFFVYYELDDDTSAHVLTLANYGGSDGEVRENFNSWVLLEQGAAAPAAAAQ